MSLHFPHRLSGGEIMTAYSKRPQAIARIKGGAEHPGIRGELRFYQECGRVLVAAHISGLPQNSETGFFGFHTHEGESCGGEGFSDTKGHYNPTLMPHPCHAGAKIACRTIQKV